MPNQVEGVIIETDGETAKVRCSIHSDCENCGMCPGANAMVIEAIDTQGVKPGDFVVVESKESHMLLTAFMVFIFPLLAVGCGIWLGYYLSPRFVMSPVLLMTLGGLLFGVTAIIVLKVMDRSLESDKPVIRSIK
ncbi:SoxR reducing system RseC family protein [Syntrophomonas palmitatica]|uniref:SoxR reducing system RseC family protein n=1 Tax=Syntrophomonas palmitatica TaxID=402877 RepID=UPI0006D275C3|nr:SoxR reducing system RseC family protein [Syntrophomonas palmitatica]